MARNPSPKSATKADIRARHLSWLNNLQSWTGKSLSRLATEAGLSDTTLSRFPREGYDGTLGDVTVESLVKTHGVPGPYDDWQLRGGRALAAREEGSPYTVADNEPAEVRRVIDALIGGRNAVDPWRLKGRSLELAGYMPGDIVAVDLNATPRSGDAVCAQVTDWRRGTSETVMRIYRETGGLKFLLAASGDMALQTPLVIDDDTVQVRGVIVGAARPWRLVA